MKISRIALDVFEHRLESEPHCTKPSEFHTILEFDENFSMVLSKQVVWKPELTTQDLVLNYKYIDWMTYLNLYAIKLIYNFIKFSLSTWNGQEEQRIESHAEEALADTN